MVIIILLSCSVDAVDTVDISIYVLDGLFRNREKEQESNECSKKYFYR